MGGRTKTSGQGRPKGAGNKATADVKALAGKYTDAAMAELGRLATKADSETARVAAIKELLDRAFGKAPVSVDMNAKGDITIKVMRFGRDNASE